MARWIRVVDTSRHMGMPIGLACFILAIITAGLNAFVLYFIEPGSSGAAYALMIYAGVSGIIGVIGGISGLRIIIWLYLLTETLAMIPVIVVLVYTSLAVSFYNCYETCPHTGCICSYPTDYTLQLIVKFGDGMLIVGICAACFALIFGSLSLNGFRKLRLAKAGVTEVIQERGQDHCHHHHEVVVVPPPTATIVAPAPVIQPVYTVPTTVIGGTAPAVVTGGVVVQQQQIYPTIPQSYY